MSLSTGKYVVIKKVEKEFKQVSERRFCVASLKDKKVRNESRKARS